MKKPILYIDMDNVLVNFQSGIDALSPEIQQEYAGRLDEVPHIFAKMKPMDGAIEAVQALSEHYEMYVLSTAPWENPTAWSDKLNWIKTYFGDIFYKRLILSHHKNLNNGDFLIDDRTANGAGLFEGEHLHFGKDYPTWESITYYLLDKAKINQNVNSIQEELQKKISAIWQTYKKEEMALLYLNGQRLPKGETWSSKHSATHLISYLQENQKCLCYEFKLREETFYLIINHKRFSSFKKIVHKWQKMYSKSFIDLIQNKYSFTNAIQQFLAFNPKLKQLNQKDITDFTQFYSSMPIGGMFSTKRREIMAAIKANLEK